MTLATLQYTEAQAIRDSAPNFVIIYSDDQRYDALGCRTYNTAITPTLDSLCASGMYFENAFVTLSICSPSRAALLTGRYGSANGVTTFGKVHLNQGERTFAQLLKALGYQTGLVGKWHLADDPKSLGFDFARYFFSNGPWYNSTVIEEGKENITEGFIEDYNAKKAIEFLEKSQSTKAPYLLFYCPQLPHLDNQFNWDVTNATLARYNDRKVSVPKSWPDENLEGKPEYLLSGRHRQQALSYGYEYPDTLLQQTKRYYAAITEMDAAMGQMLAKVRELPNADNTYIIFMSDNGWFIGDHLFTSKVLAYEESIRVPLIINGPGIKAGTNQDLVLNIDILPTLLDIVKEKKPSRLHGKSLLTALRQKKSSEKRAHIYYQAPTPQLGSYPLAALRTDRYKYIETYSETNTTEIVFRELYDLKTDPYELSNLINDSAYDQLVQQLQNTLQQEKQHY
ncbi:MAG: sulfatase-like hydrolase/transferase [Cyclobacteriaceae bacterium]